MIIVRKVEVVPFCEQWATMFAEEAEKLKQVFGAQNVCASVILAARPSRE